MTAFFSLFDVSLFVTGGAFVWFGKPAIQKFVLGVNKYSAMLHAQASALEAKAAAAAAAIKKV